MKSALSKYFTRVRGDIKPGVYRMTQLLEGLNFSFRPGVFRILVSGTNGKGTFCSQIERVFRDLGYTTGLYTSPHLVSPCERIRISGEPVAEQELELVLSEVESAAAQALPDATFFELFSAAAFLLFQKKGVQVEVVEVGLGGRLDSTNVLPLDVAVLTSIGLDHCEILGSTLDKISFEKAYASRRGKPLISPETHPRAQEGILKAVQLTGALWQPSNDAIFDVINAASLAGLPQWKAPTQIELQTSLKKVFWPGRFDLRYLSFQGRARWVLFDAAHNSHGLTFFLKNFSQWKLKNETPACKLKVKIVFGTLNDKDWTEGLQMLAQSRISSHFVFTQCSDNPRRVNPSLLKERLSEISSTAEAKSFEVLTDALSSSFDQKLPGTEDFMILVIGSIALLGECFEALSTPVFPEDKL